MEGGKEFNTPPKAQHTFRRKARDNTLSPGNLRASKLYKQKDEAMIERMHIIMRTEVSLMRAEMEGDMQAVLEAQKQEMYKAMKTEFDKALITMKSELRNELKTEMTNWVEAETQVTKTLVDKLDSEHKTLLKWRTEMEVQIGEMTKITKDLTEKLASLGKKSFEREAGQGTDEIQQIQKDLKELKLSLGSELEKWAEFGKQQADNSRLIKDLRKEEVVGPQIQEEVKELKTSLENEVKSWSKVVKQHEDNTKWIEGARKGKSIEATPPSTIINLTLEEEEKRRKRALHVRITGLKDSGKVEEEVSGLLKMLNIKDATHNGAWRVGKEGVDKEGKPRERALIMRFPTLEARKEFLKKRPALKKTGIFLGDDLTLAQVAHMQEKMPEIRAAREQGKIAFYRGGKVVIVDGRSS